VHLYLHIPFCHHICPYCGFYKHTPGALANRKFVEAILDEAERRTGGKRPAVETVYFGGGTPSLLSPTLLELLCRGITERFDFSGVEEWTIEANPATFDHAKARLLRELGVARVSLGVQSFHPEILEILGRDHTADEAESGFQVLREAGFDNIGIDLMFSIPGQDPGMWMADLARTASLEPEHISAYNLTYEEDTEFLERHRSGDLDSDEDRDAGQFYAALDFLESRGYGHYEISNYARPGFESRHNRAYWSGADYLGLGPGAVSTIEGTRWRTLPDTAAYVRAATSGIDTRVEIENLSPEDLRLERIALQLRTKEGLDAGDVAADRVEPLVEQGLVNLDGGRCCLTRAGKALADPIAAALA
jgi:oxygen-independent coproporphyrinogen-3 oxidase